jgi:L-cysteine desulfidase
MTRNEAIKSLMKENIVVAVGCTEPVAVALCVSKAKEELGEEVEKVNLFLSKNIIKNAMGVGIPGTGMIGLPIAIALGVVCGESKKELEVLCEGKNHVDEAKKWLENHAVEIKPKDTSEKLYIECVCYGKNNYSKAIIAQSHTNFVHVQKNDTILLHKDISNNCENKDACQDVLSTLTAKEVYNYAVESKIEDLKWIFDTVKLNEKCSNQGIEGKYGLQIGRLLFNSDDKSERKEIIARTCAASDARMDGITLPIYSNSGSGNQGITCTLPVYFFGKKKNKSEEEIIRGLTLSHLMSIYIKSKIGRLSALCGAVNASMGAASGIVYLSGGNFHQICFAINNMINTITGMVCDGAKPSCALKIATALNSAFDSVLLAMNNVVVNPTDGIAETDIDCSINDLGKIGRESMNATDDMILEIMTNKK